MNEELINATTSISNTLTSYIALDVAGLVPLLLGLITLALSYLTKEKEFNEEVRRLLELILDKKVAALNLLVDSIQFNTSENLEEATEFKGKRFFIDIDKFSILENKVKKVRRKFKFLVSSLNYIVALAVISAGLLVINIELSVITGYILTTIVFVGLVYAIIAIRKYHICIQEISESEDLRHNE